MDVVTELWILRALILECAVYTCIYLNSGCIAHGLIDRSERIPVRQNAFFVRLVDRFPEITGTLLTQNGFMSIACISMEQYVKLKVDLCL